MLYLASLYQLCHTPMWVLIFRIGFTVLAMSFLIFGDFNIHLSYDSSINCSAVSSYSVKS